MVMSNVALVAVPPVRSIVPVLDSPAAVTVVALVRLVLPISNVAVGQGAADRQDATAAAESVDLDKIGVAKSAGHFQRRRRRTAGQFDSAGIGDRSGRHRRRLAEAGVADIDRVEAVVGEGAADLGCCRRAAKGIDLKEAAVSQTERGRQRGTVFEDESAAVAGERGQRAVVVSAVPATSAAAPLRESSAPLPIAVIPPLANSSNASPERSAVPVHVAGAAAGCPMSPGSPRRRSARSCRYWTARRPSRSSPW